MQNEKLLEEVKKKLTSQISRLEEELKKVDRNLYDLKKAR